MSTSSASHLLIAYLLACLFTYGRWGRYVVVVKTWVSSTRCN